MYLQRGQRSKRPACRLQQRRRFGKRDQSKQRLLLFEVSIKDIYVRNRSYRTSMAVESGDAKYVDTTALRVGVKPGRADSGESAGSEEGNDGELHLEGVWKCWYYNRLLVSVEECSDDCCGRGLMRMRRIGLMPGEMVDFILFSTTLESNKGLLCLLNLFRFSSFSSKFMAVLGRLYAGRETESPSQSRSRCTTKGIGRETESSSTT